MLLKKIHKGAQVVKKQKKIAAIIGVIHFLKEEEKKKRKNNLWVLSGRIEAMRNRNLGQPFWHRFRLGRQI